MKQPNDQPTDQSLVQTRDQSLDQSKGQYEDNRPVKIYNTFSGQKEALVPLIPGKVRMYVCGMTVYDYCHLGHARVLVVFDVVTRYLRACGLEVTYVRNVTDIDDKIIARAAENNEDIYALTERFTQFMHEDAAALGTLPPDEEPRATQYIPQIIALIETLIERDHAYEAANHDVYYDINGFAPYGQLSGKRTEDLRAGERVEVDENKRDPLDFVLWKAAKPGEPQWDSPWGAGRPGWHIECSAMSTHCLGNHFDIHGGGQDLQFPHHENEIAQTEGATGEKFVNLWMHNGFVRIDEEKMSKSLGNFFTVREILKSYQAEDIRFFMLSSHYRSPLNYSDENLDIAKAALARLYTALRDLSPAVDEHREVARYEARFHLAMDDDFNTPEAMAVLFDLAREVNRQRDSDLAAAASLAAGLKRLGNVVGLLESAPETHLQGAAGEAGFSDADIEALIAARKQARSDKDWAEADRVRDQLAEAGVSLEDTAKGTSWRRT